MLLPTLLPDTVPLFAATVPQLARHRRLAGVAAQVNVHRFASLVGTIVDDDDAIEIGEIDAGSLEAGADGAAGTAAGEPVAIASTSAVSARRTAR